MTIRLCKLIGDNVSERNHKTPNIIVNHTFVVYHFPCLLL